MSARLYANWQQSANFLQTDVQQTQNEEEPALIREESFREHLNNHRQVSLSLLFCEKWYGNILLQGSRTWTFIYAECIHRLVQHNIKYLLIFSFQQSWQVFMLAMQKEGKVTYLNLQNLAMALNEHYLFCLIFASWTIHTTYSIPHGTIWSKKLPLGRNQHGNCHSKNNLGKKEKKKTTTTNNPVNFNVFPTYKFPQD